MNQVYTMVYVYLICLFNIFHMFNAVYTMVYAGRGTGKGDEKGERD